MKKDQFLLSHFVKPSIVINFFWQLTSDFGQLYLECLGLFIYDKLDNFISEFKSHILSFLHGL